jgi:hypothetical protein
MRRAPLVLVALVAADAAAEPQLVTLERADRGARIGLQSSVQLYPDFPDNVGVRTELYAQSAKALQNGGAIGAYGHAAFAVVVGEGDTVSALSSIQIGGLYVSKLGERSDLVWTFGLTLPTASEGEDETIANVVTQVERNHDLVTAIPDQVALHLGATLRAAMGGPVFLQGDVAADVGQHHAPMIHLNFGVGAWVGPAALLGEVATTFVEGQNIASVAVGARFAVPGRPHVAYVLALADDDTEIAPDGGVLAHMISVGAYLPL